MSIFAVLGYILLAIILYQAYAYLRVQLRIKFYKAQGICVLPNAGVPVVGNMLDWAEYEGEVARNPEPSILIFPWSL